MRKKVCVLIGAMLMILGMTLNVYASEISPLRVGSCSSCGGPLKTRFENVRTNTVIGTCEDDPSVKHYRAYRYKVYICIDCGNIELREIFETGHYCECDCSDSGCWCWD